MKREHKRTMKGYANGFDVALVGRADGLNLWWDVSVQVEVIDSSKHFIDAQGHDLNSEVGFRFTGIYGTS